MDINISQTEEIWKPLAGYENFYEISNYGRIKRLKGFWCKKDRIKSYEVSNAGYYRVKLEKNRVGKKYCVHRLVAQSFLLFKNNEKVVNHIDGDKLNNKVINLEYISKSENQKHAYKIGLQKIQKGSKRINVAKLHENDVIEIRRLYAQGNIFMKDLSKKYNVSETTINFIINRKRWTHV